MHTAVSRSALRECCIYVLVCEHVARATAETLASAKVQYQNGEKGDKNALRAQVTTKRQRKRERVPSPRYRGRKL